MDLPELRIFAAELDKVGQLQVGGALLLLPRVTIRHNWYESGRRPTLMLATWSVFRRCSLRIALTAITSPVDFLCLNVNVPECLHLNTLLSSSTCRPCAGAASARVGCAGGGA